MAHASTIASLPDFAREYLQQQPRAAIAVHRFHAWLRASHRPLKQLESRELERFLATLASQPLSKATRALHSRRARHYLDWLREGQLLRALTPSAAAALPALAGRFIQALAPTHKPSTLNGYRSTLGRFHRWLFVSRALDLLLEQLMKRRFAVRHELEADARAPASPHAPSEAGPRDPTVPSSPEAPTAQMSPTNTAAAPTPSCGATAAVPASDALASPRGRHVPNDVRRAVFARDGAGCAWRGPDGVRCNSRAWLELDHITPFACGGDHHPANIRIFCRAHNRLAAEQAFGKDGVGRRIARRRRQARAAGAQSSRPSNVWSGCR